MKNVAKMAVICAVATLGFVTLSAPMAADQEQGQRQGPPPEAFEACASLSEQDSCSFTSPRGEANGQCVVPPKGDSSQLICMPEGHEERSKQQG